METEVQEKKTYHIVCNYTSSLKPSQTRVKARNCTDALEWAENYFTTIALTIKRIDVFDGTNPQPVLTKQYVK